MKKIKKRPCGIVGQVCGTSSSTATYPYLSIGPLLIKLWSWGDDSGKNVKWRASLSLNPHGRALRRLDFQEFTTRSIGTQGSRKGIAEAEVTAGIREEAKEKRSLMARKKGNRNEVVSLLTQYNSLLVKRSKRPKVKTSRALLGLRTCEARKSRLRST